MFQLRFSRFQLNSFLKISCIFVLAAILSSCGPGEGEPVTADTEVLSVGSGSGANFTKGILSASKTNFAAGEATTIQVNVVNQAGNPPIDSTPTITFSSICVSTSLASFGELNTDVPGLVTVVYTTEGCTGTDIITATLVETGATAIISLAIASPQVLTVSFVSSTVLQLSLAGMGGGGVESTELVFKVTGALGVPVIGEQVSFSLSATAGGINLAAGTATDLSDDDGLVRTTLNSGTTAASVSVLARHDATGTSGASDNITVSSGIPVASRFSMSLSSFNPANAFNTDGVEVTINIIASDQFGNNPTDGTQVIFNAPENGNIEGSCELIDGTCGVIWRSSTPRPPDHRLEIIAYTPGAEDFVDTNGNSVYDGADTFTDLGEPFADENENGHYDVGEFFFDTNKNELRDTGNGHWDGPCLSFIYASALCTGETSITIYKTATIVMSTNTPRIVTLGSFPAGVITVQENSRVELNGLVIADNNLAAAALGNPLPSGTTLTFTITGGAGASIQGVTSYTTGNTLTPEFLTVTVVATDVVPPATLPSGLSLTLTIVTPDSTTTLLSWPLNITF